MAKRKTVRKVPARTAKRAQQDRQVDWDHLEDALAGAAPRGKSRTAAQAEVDRLFDENEKQHLQRLARRAKLVRSRQAPLGNVVFLPGITGSNLDVIDASGDKDHIWINLFRILSGRLADLQLAASGSAEADPALTVRASGINKTFYARAVMALRARWNVEPLAYDWRRDIDQASDLLADFIRARFADRPCHLVVHSLGGLVARNFIRRHPQLWENMKDPELIAGGRLIMLGTPNYGSFAIPSVLTGADEMIEMLARVDFAHNLRELLAISNTFIGTYMLLPSPSKLKPHLHSIFQKETWGTVPGVSQRHLSRTFQFHTELERASTIDPARMLYVAGCKRVPPTGMSIVAAGEFEYELTSDGDGRVSHELGLLPDVPTYYIDEAHGDLARNEKVLSAVDEMLQTGQTDLLGTTVLRRADRVMHSMREYRTAADKRMLEELGRIADRAVTSEAQLSDEERRFAEEAIIKTALGSSARSMPKAPAALPRARAKAVTPSDRAQLQVSIKFDDIVDIKAPVVVVGHYRGVLPTNAIGAIDKKLGGWITRAVRQGMIAGTLGETFYVPTAGRLAAQSVVIAGMGEFGRFSAPDLRLIMSNVAQGASGLGYSTIATVLVGAGNGNLNRETALREILEGFGNGLAQSGNGGEPPKLQVIIVERSAARFFELTEKLAELAAAQSLSSAQITMKKASAQEIKRARASERRERKPASVGEGRSDGRADEVRITVECTPDDDGLAMSAGPPQAHCVPPRGADAQRPGANTYYRFSALSQQAVVPVREVKVNRHFAFEAARALREAGTREEQQKYGRLLYDYLIPQDFLDVLDGNQPLRLIVDRATAAFPWEMACFPSRSGAAPLRWLGTDLQLSRQFRTLLSQAPGLTPPVNDRVRALVIADPAPERELQLVGARIEGRRVADILKSANGQDFGGGKLKIDVVERIGASECDPIEILALLLMGDFDIVHYAGHGDYQAQAPEQSGWIFGADTVLAARDIFRARKVPRMVFANACFSGVLQAGQAFAADELSAKGAGLATIAQAFFERGVPNYIGTGWPVDDAQALTTAETFYKALLRRMSIGAALSAARRKVFDEQIESTWGAYQHYGNPQDRLLRVDDD